METYQPKSVVIHERFVVNASPDSVPDVGDIYSVFFPRGIKVIPYNSSTDVRLPVECPWLDALAQTKSLAGLPMVAMESSSKKILVGRVNGSLKSADYRYTFEPKEGKGDGKLVIQSQAGKFLFSPYST